MPQYFAAESSKHNLEVAQSRHPGFSRVVSCHKLTRFLNPSHCPLRQQWGVSNRLDNVLLFCMEDKPCGIFQVRTATRHMSSCDHIWLLSEVAVSPLITSLRWSPCQQCRKCSDKQGRESRLSRPSTNWGVEFHVLCHFDCLPCSFSSQYTLTPFSN